MALKKRESNTYKVGRDSSTGKFIPVKQAERRKSTAVVETIKIKDRTYSTHSDPIHTTSGVSGAEIIRGLKIKQSDVQAAKNLVEKSQKGKTTHKK